MLAVSLDFSITTEKIKQGSLSILGSNYPAGSVPEPPETMATVMKFLKIS